MVPVKENTTLRIVKVIDIIHSGFLFLGLKFLKTKSHTHSKILIESAKRLLYFIFVAEDEELNISIFIYSGLSAMVVMLFSK